MTLTEMQLRAIMPAARPDAIAAWIGPLRDAMAANAIDTPQRMAGFLASVANETGQLSATTEASYIGTPYDYMHDKVFAGRTPSPAQLAQWKTLGRARFDVEFFNWVYDDRRWPFLGLGNDQEGDGFKYRGRGPGQITGKNNYRREGAKRGLDLVANPDLLLDPATGAAAFATYWVGAGNIARLDAGDAEGSFRAMNPGLSSFAPHMAHYDRALKVLNAPEPKPAPATMTAAVTQAATGKTGAAAGVAAIASTVTVADAVSKVGEVRTLSDATKGFLGTFLPSPYTEIGLGVLVVLAIGFMVWRYVVKLRNGQAVAT